ncbi:hypothetical protein [Rufibacter sp. XAAS-G3-1]|uniref:hypothetical protein n=1 Tax=Rufibacter sp. XAAS-G3-1 TaxID=2729134 RepID=UPI0015E7203D|nr:hypothetical protein [Rufibacter sp. XAAS-G3-1]
MRKALPTILLFFLTFTLMAQTKPLDIGLPKAAKSERKKLLAFGLTLNMIGATTYFLVPTLMSKPIDYSIGTRKFLKEALDRNEGPEEIKRIESRLIQEKKKYDDAMEKRSKTIKGIRYASSALFCVGLSINLAAIYNRK